MMTSNAFSKEFFTDKIKSTVKTALSFHRSELYSVAHLYKGKLLCLIELLHEIDPEYKLDELLQKDMEKVLGLDYVVFTNIVSEERVDED